MTPTKRMTAITVALAMAAALPAVAAADEHDTVAEVRVLHAAVDAPAVDIYASGALLGGPLAYGEISDYIEVPAGTYQVQVVPTGFTPADGSAVVDRELVFEPETKTTVAATGSLQAGIVPKVLLDTPAPKDGISQVRVTHFVFYAPAVDVAVDGAEIVVPDLAFTDSSGYLDLPEGEYDLELRVAGTKDVVLDIKPATLDDNTSYSVFAIGSVADDDLFLVPALDASPDLETRIEEGLEDLEEEVEEGLAGLQEELEGLFEEEE